MRNKDREVQRSGCGLRASVGNTSPEGQEERPEYSPPCGMQVSAMIKLKRVYESPSKEDGIRILVERLWPRGIKKTSLRLDFWEKEVAPSDGLRKWFGHDPARWQEFRRRYFAELDANPGAWEPVLEAARHGAVTLIYSSHDEEHNNAVALKQYLDGKLGRGTSRQRSAA